MATPQSSRGNSEGNKAIESHRAAANIQESSTSSGQSIKDEQPTGSISNTPEDETPEPPPAAAAPTMKQPYRRLFGHGSVTVHSLRACGAIAAVILGAAVPLFAIVVGALVNELNRWASGDQDVQGLKNSAARNALYLVYIFVACLVCAYASAFCFKTSATRAAAGLRETFIRALLSQDIGYLDTCSAGTMGALVSNNADMVEHGVGERLTLLISGVTTLVAALVVAFVQTWQLSLVVVASISLSAACASFAMKTDTKVTAQLLAIYAKAAGLAEEALSTVQIVAAFGAQKKLQAKYDAHLDAASRINVRQGPLRAVRYGIVFTGMYVSYSIAWFFGSWLVASERVDHGGRIVTVIYALLTASASINSVASVFPDVSKAAGAAQGLFDIMDRTPMVDALSDGGARPPPGPGCVAFRDVSFAYPSRPTVTVLQNVSVKFEAGKTTAIVGSSGSGKSTMLALLARWFGPGSGEILLDGEDISTVNVQWLRRRMGFVQQEPVLFRDTIYNNVAHGLERMTTKPADVVRAALVRQACKKAFAHDFIEALPDTYETVLGDRGDTLSGGQKQRIAIARSIVSDPPILLLDEATSALDPEAEKMVQSALENVSRAKTTIVIAHKLSTVKSADKIVVMNDGRVVEQGTHQELLAREGTYAGLYNAQTQGTPTISPEPPSPTDEPAEAVNEKPLDPVARAAIVSPEKPPQRTKTPFIAAFLVRIIAYRSNLWPLHLGTLLCSVGAGAVYPAQAIIFSRAVTVFQYRVPEESSSLQSEGCFWGGMYLAVAVGVLTAYSGFRFFSSLAAALITRDYRSEYFAAMLGQDAAFFEKPDNAAGAMVARLSSNPQRVQDLMATNIAFIIVALINVTSSCILALAVGWRLALVAMAGGLVPLLISGFFRIRIETMAQAQNAKAYRECARFAGEAVGAMRTVASLTLERKIIAEYQGKLSVALHSMARYNAVSSIFVGLSDSMMFAAVALVFWYGTVLVAQGDISVRSFFIVFVATIVGGQSAGFMFGFTLHTTKARGAANDVFSLLDAQAPINSSTGVAPPESTTPDSPAIRFAGVTFCYPNRPQKPALRKLMLSIPRGAHIGIVGASGSGKSTIISMIERFYDPSSGSVQIDGVALTALDVQAHRGRVGYVSQQTTLYDGTIRENILLGVSDKVADTSGLGTDAKSAGDSLSRGPGYVDRIIRACQAANIHDFIVSLPQGYDTEVGARGVALSGGQRQRMAIARALIRDPDILLFDEATSALDSQSELVVQQAIERVARANAADEVHGDEKLGAVNQRRPRTTVVVAHRLSTVRSCDRIFVLHDGAVSEEGSHHELMALGGRYAEMVRTQAIDS